AIRPLFIALLLHALPAPASRRLPRLFTSSSMVWLGQYRYGLYVYHHVLFCYFSLHRTEFVVVQGGAGIAVSMLRRRACPLPDRRRGSATCRRAGKASARPGSRTTLESRCRTPRS